jgi:hypothetical protein
VEAAPFGMVHYPLSKGISTIIFHLWLAYANHKKETQYECGDRRRQ